MLTCFCRGDSDVFAVNADFKSKFTKIKVKTVTAAKETAEEAQKTRSKVDDDRKPLVSLYCCVYILRAASVQVVRRGFDAGGGSSRPHYEVEKAARAQHACRRGHYAAHSQCAVTCNSHSTARVADTLASEWLYVSIRLACDRALTHGMVDLCFRRIHSVTAIH